MKLLITVAALAVLTAVAFAEDPNCETFDIEDQEDCFDYCDDRNLTEEVRFRAYEVCECEDADENRFRCRHTRFTEEQEEANRVAEESYYAEIKVEFDGVCEDEFELHFGDDSKKCIFANQDIFTRPNVTDVMAQLDEIEAYYTNFCASSCLQDLVAALNQLPATCFAAAEVDDDDDEDDDDGDDDDDDDTVSDRRRHDDDEKERFGRRIREDRDDDDDEFKFRFSPAQLAYECAFIDVDTYCGVGREVLLALVLNETTAAEACPILFDYGGCLGTTLDFYSANADRYGFNATFLQATANQVIADCGAVNVDLTAAAASSASLGFSSSATTAYASAFAAFFLAAIAVLMQ
jgi:hypothetical protein